jgi:glyceraldehyde-3-phosphate dehydrogenase (NADP+)
MNYIDGIFTEGEGKELEVIDKYTKELVGCVRLADQSQIKKTLKSSVKGFEDMRQLSAGDRKKILLAIADGVAKKKSEFAQTISTEAGKPIDYANTEVDRSLDTLRLAAEESIRFSGEKLNLDYDKAAGRTAYTLNMPMGPILGITPFNFPLNLMMHKVAPAIATGNSIIIKPASSTPLTSILFARVIDEIDCPRGMFNLVIAPGSEMDILTESEEIKKITFTGSDKVGWGLKKNCGKKHITLELGGNAPVIIDSDDRLEKIAEEVAYGISLYAGQICISTQRVIVLDHIYDKFRDLLVSSVEAIKYGNPHETGIISGPVISTDEADRIYEWIQEAVDGGAVILAGGEYDKTHNLIHPTLIESAPESSKVIKEEIFGPVGVLQKANDFSSAIDIANDTRFGLQCGVYTDSINNMKMAQNKLRYGGVIFNSVPGFRMDSMPYGGVGDSGFGREGTIYAMRSMVESKLIVL